MKVGNLKAKVGTYEKDGQTKGRYVDVGVLMQSQDGGYYVLMNPTFNPAGVPMEQGKDMVMVSVFQDQQQNQQPQQNQGYQQQPQGGYQQPNPNNVQHENVQQQPNYQQQNMNYNQ